jgi:hypothetical protein
MSVGNVRAMPDELEAALRETRARQDEQARQDAASQQEAEKARVRTQKGASAFLARMQRAGNPGRSAVFIEWTPSPPRGRFRRSAAPREVAIEGWDLEVHQGGHGFRFGLTCDGRWIRHWVDTGGQQWTSESEIMSGAPYGDPDAFLIAMATVLLKHGIE